MHESVFKTFCQSRSIENESKVVVGLREWETQSKIKIQKTFRPKKIERKAIKTSCSLYCDSDLAEAHVCECVCVYVGRIDRLYFISMTLLLTSSLKYLYNSINLCNFCIVWEKRIGCNCHSAIATKQIYLAGNHATHRTRFIHTWLSIYMLYSVEFRFYPIRIVYIFHE